MMRIKYLLPLMILMLSCKTSKQSDNGNGTDVSINKEKTNEEVTKLTKDFNTWYNYTFNKIHLSGNYVSLDLDGNELDKRTFLNKLTSGKFIVLKMVSESEAPVYKLYNLKKKITGIEMTIAGMANSAISLLNMEGKELPEYDFTDLNGNKYNKEIVKGKIMVLKCWFIRCVACVKEFPDLNKLVDQYKNRSDIMFVSLATDPKEDLTNFLNKKPFNYAVVGNMNDYINNKLMVNTYPLHLLVSKQGKVIKATNSLEDLIPALESDMGKY